MKSKTLLSLFCTAAFAGGAITSNAQTAYTWDGGDDGVRLNRGGNYNPNAGNNSIVVAAGDTFTVQAGVNQLGLLTGSTGNAGFQFFLNDPGSFITSSSANGNNVGTNFTIFASGVPLNTSFTINAGGFSTGSGFLRMDGGGSFTFNGGALNVGNQLSASNGGAFSFTGGTATVNSLVGSLSPASTFSISGGNFGATSLALGNGNRIDVSGGAISLNTVTQWGGIIDVSGLGASLTTGGYTLAEYQARYASGNLLYNGSNADPFGKNFEVVGSTLTAVPEPGAFALMGLGTAALVMLRRRNRR
ncbi:MAG: PEP-CTERM sorting domain-containing protein [Chthoniobacterales bacterium]